MPSKADTQSPFSSKAIYGFSIIDHAVSLERITRQDAELLAEFLAERRAAAGISTRRTDKLSFTLVSWRRFLPPFRELTIGRIYTGIESLKQSNSLRGRPYKQNTIVDHVAILKQFLLWMIDNEYSDLPEKKVKAIKTPKKPTMTKTASQLLNPDEVQALVAACSTSRDRALIMTLYEGGFRLGEISQLTWGDLKSDERGIAMNVDFKTGIPRYIRIVMAKKYLAEWRGDYPVPVTPESPVFLNQQRHPVTWAGIAVQLRRIAKRAGITKHITPHLFRHSRITHLLQEGASETAVKLMMWGTINTKMLMTYAHLTGKDIDAEISRLYGLQDPKTDKERFRLEPILCPSCNLINPPGMDYCRNCMEALTPEACAEEESIRRFVLKNSTMLRRYLDRVEQEQPPSFSGKR